VRKIDNMTIAITYPISAFNPIILKINLGDNVVTVDKQEVGAYATWPYGVFSVNSTGGPTVNYVNPCNKTIQLNLLYTVAAGSFGSNGLALKKI